MQAALKALLNTKPRDTDPENVDAFGQNTASLFSHDDVYDKDFVPVEASAMRRAQADAAEMPGAFGAVKASRKDLEDSSDDSSESADDDDGAAGSDDASAEGGEWADMLQGGASSDDESEEESEQDTRRRTRASRKEQAPVKNSKTAAKKQTKKTKKNVTVVDDMRSSSSNSDDEDEDEDEDDNDDMDEEDDSQDDDDDDDDDDDAGGALDGDLAAEMAAMQEEEKDAQVNLMRARQDDAKQAEHVSHQKALYDSMLHTRILLQKCMHNANSLPVGSDRLALFTNKNDTASGLCDDVRQELGSLMSSLLSLRHSLTAQTASAPAELIDAADAFAVDTDDLGSTWEALDEYNQHFWKQRDEVMTKWHNKVNMSAGLHVTKFRALNQDVVSQIRNIMGDRPRLLKRTQLKRGKYETLGRSEAEETAVKMQTEENNGEELNEDLFDDTDFYQQQLKELLEASASRDVDDPFELGKRALAARKLQIKTHRKVDRRASKGRRLKYEVQPRIENFTAPAPWPAATMSADGAESMCDVLFPRLFGGGYRASRLAERDEEESGDGPQAR